MSGTQPDGDSFEADGVRELARVWRVVSVDEGNASPFGWGSIQWLCDGQIFADAQQTFGYVRIEPGAKNPRHLHPNSDEVLLLLEGELQHSLGEESYQLLPGMAIHIPQGVEHDARNTGDVTARMVVAYPTSDRRVVMREEGQE
jgi:quercetin dioxygenase-like cupin family protein